MRPLILLAALGTLLLACNRAAIRTGQEPPETGYLATASAEAAAARLDRNPLLPTPTAARGSGSGSLTLTGSLYLVAYADSRSSSTLLRGGIDTPGGDMEDCTGIGAYEELRDGAAVVVSDETGRVLGRGVLSEGRAGTLSGREPGSDLEQLVQDTLTCSFTFRVEDLPRAQSYTLEVADKGQVSYPAEEIQTLGWEAHLSLAPDGLRVMPPGPS